MNEKSCEHYGVKKSEMFELEEAEWPPKILEERQNKQCYGIILVSLYEDYLPPLLDVL